MEHHNLDISPTPENVLYINETLIADESFYYYTSECDDLKEEDDVRIYIPMDLNQSAILRRLYLIGCNLGDPTEANEPDYWTKTQQIIAQLEIYDQVWYVRERNYPDEPGEHDHSKHARALVEQILDILEVWALNSSVELFPYDEINELEETYGITRSHEWG